MSEVTQRDFYKNLFESGVQNKAFEKVADLPDGVNGVCHVAVGKGIDVETLDPYVNVYVVKYEGETTHMHVFNSQKNAWTQYDLPFSVAEGNAIKRVQSALAEEVWVLYGGQLYYWNMNDEKWTQENFGIDVITEFSPDPSVPGTGVASPSGTLLSQYYVIDINTKKSALLINNYNEPDHSWPAAYNFVGSGALWAWRAKVLYKFTETFNLWESVEITMDENVSKIFGISPNGGLYLSSGLNVEGGITLYFPETEQKAIIRFYDTAGKQIDMAQCDPGCSLDAGGFQGEHIYFSCTSGLYRYNFDENN